MSNKQIINFGILLHWFTPFRPSFRAQGGIEFIRNFFGGTAMRGINRLEWIFIVLSIVLSACSTQGGVTTDTPQLHQKRLVESTVVASPIGELFELDAPGPGVIQVSVARSDRYIDPQQQPVQVDAKAAPQESIVTFSVSEPFDARRQAKVGTSDLEMQFPLADGDEPVVVQMQTNGGRLNFGVFDLDGNLDIIIDYLPDLTTINVDLPKAPIGCSGHLLGFDHPMRFTDPSHGGRERLRRKGVMVRCEAYYVYGAGGRQHTIHAKSGFTFTDDQGHYAVTIRPRPVSVIVPVNTNQILDFDPNLVWVRAECVTPQQCGYEAYGVADPALVLASEADSAYESNIRNVLHLVASAPAEPEITAGGQTFLPQRIMLGARLVSNGANHPELNDKPFILHEQTDVLQREGTEFLSWGLLGQPVHTTREKPNGDVVDADPRKNPCDMQSDVQVCSSGTDDCNYEICGTGDVACLGYPILQTLLDEGYDVWLVDALDGDADLLHQAAAAPLLYQKILNYGGPLGGFDPFPFAVSAVTFDQSFLSTALTPVEPEAGHIWPGEVADAADLGFAIPEEPFTPPVPMSGDRQAVVAGYSQGGVLARVGLLLWEHESNLPIAGVVDARGLPVQIGRDRNVFLESIEDKINLYASVDAPQRGATIPLAVQAYFQRIGDVIKSFDDVGLHARNQVDSALRELNSAPTRQVLTEYVTASGDYGCYKIKNGKLDPGETDNCFITPGMVANEVEVTSVDFDRFQASTIFNLDTGDRPDGIPDRVRSIAIANGAFGERDVKSNELIDVKFDIERFRDRHHHQCAADGTCHIEGFPGVNQPKVQPGGAQWNGICQRVGDVQLGLAVLDTPGKWFGKACWNPAAAVAAGLTLGGSCATGMLWGLLEGFDFNLRGIKLSYPMSAKLDDEGEIIEGTGFPTLVPTTSALLADDNGNPSPGWHDAYWQETSKFHTNFDNNMCKFLMYHLDGSVEGDADGYPACGTQTFRAQCDEGGRLPGKVRAPNGFANTGDIRRLCDCDDDDPTSHPGAFEIPFDGADNDCDGTIDEFEIVTDL